MRSSRRVLLFLALSAWSLFTWAILIYHYSDLKPPRALSTEGLKVEDYARWIDKSEIGINQLILTGPPFERGWAAGQLTKDLLLAEEEELTARLRRMIPSDFLIHVLQVVGIRWYWGIEQHIKPEHLEEMYGTSFGAPEKFNYMLPAYPRQLAYHGLHEVGQMMVDRKGADFGCTVLAAPTNRGWVVARNFDFEGGRIFDDEKIMKWVFPETGFAHLSIIWAGMVGAVTGVNEKGVYISINAAGSDEYVRFGNPTTLVIFEALEKSKNAEEAVEIIKKAKVFITDIFVVADASGKLYKIEKSPEQQEVFEVTEAIAIANHLRSKLWENDPVNKMRSSELTSHYREASGWRILKKLHSQDPKEVTRQLLVGLRDKKSPEGETLTLGNRRAIDAMIATHAVIYDSTNQKLYVSRGPAVTRSLIGFDLKASFEQHRPVVADELPPDLELNPSDYENLKNAQRLTLEAKARLKLKRCVEAETLLAPIPKKFLESSDVQEVLGDVKACQKNINAAKIHWKQALDLQPPYSSDVQDLLRKVN